MSRSKSEGGTSPATKAFEWDATEGDIKYYNKETKTNEHIKLPFTFLALDRLSTIKGYSDTDSSGIWSNSIKNIKKEPFVVRTKKGVIARGLYDSIKGDMANTGAKYATQLWIAYYEEKELKIATFTLFGAGGSAFIEFSKSNDIFKNAIAIKNSTTGKKGKTVYEMPNFEVAKVSDETDALAKELDAVVQDYLKDYLNKPDEDGGQEKKSAMQPNPEVDEVQKAKDNIDVPF